MNSDCALCCGVIKKLFIKLGLCENRLKFMPERMAAEGNDRGKLQKAMRNLLNRNLINPVSKDPAPLIMITVNVVKLQPRHPLQGKPRLPDEAKLYSDF